MSEKISVAMAAYQGAAYISTQLDSILCQLGNDDEVIVSYDQSTDETLKILESYHAVDSRVKIFCNDHPGVTGNFNNALAHCTGDYIYISDQDDKWAKNKVATVQKCFKETGADFVFHNATHTNEKLEPIGKPFFELYNIKKGVFRQYVKPRMSGCCMAFNRKMKDIMVPLPQTKGYDQWISLVCEIWGKLAFCEDILLYHRLHDNNVTPLKHRPYKVVLESRAKVAYHLIKRSHRLKARRSS